MPSSSSSTESLFLSTACWAAVGGGVGVIVEIPGPGTTIPSGRLGAAIGSETGSPTPGSVPSCAAGWLDRRAVGVDGSVSSSLVINGLASRVPPDARFTANRILRPTSCNAIGGPTPLDDPGGVRIDTRHHDHLGWLRRRSRRKAKRRREPRGGRQRAPQPGTG